MRVLPLGAGSGGCDRKATSSLEGERNECICVLPSSRQMPTCGQGPVLGLVALRRSGVHLSGRWPAARVCPSHRGSGAHRFPDASSTLGSALLLWAEPPSWPLLCPSSPLPLLHSADVCLSVCLSPELPPPQNPVGPRDLLFRSSLEPSERDLPAALTFAPHLAPLRPSPHPRLEAHAGPLGHSCSLSTPLSPSPAVLLPTCPGPLWSLSGLELTQNSVGTFPLP